MNHLHFFKTIDACRLCGSKNLQLLFALGDQFVIRFLEADDKDTPSGPLDLMMCSRDTGGCGLVQLRHSFSPDEMYRTYWYRSGINKTMTDELVGIAEKVKSMAALNAGDYVIDIGSNDSTLLRGYNTPGLKLIGYEPARHLAEKYGLKGVDKVFFDYFNYPVWENEFPSKKAKAITAISMFYDLEDPNAFTVDIVRCLDPEGIFVVQQNYLPYMLERNVVDNIAHEHLSYYSLSVFKSLMERNGLEVFDVELSLINGGSFRAYMKLRNSGKNIIIDEGAAERVQKIVRNEEDARLSEKVTYDAFIRRVRDIGDTLAGFIRRETSAGKKIYVYGASTRGNSLLQVFGIDHTMIVAAADRNPDKWGKKMVGTGIPIISEAEAREKNPDYFLVLPWAFFDEFVKREALFFQRGGKFIIPLPEFRVVDQFGRNSTADDL